jgi:hypothetical protein
MLICDKCGAEIPEGSRFCPQCADPVTEIDRVAKSVEESVSQAPTEPTAQTKLVCPKCEGQFPYEVMPSRSVYSIRCPGCHREFLSRVVHVRAKRSRGSKKENRRRFSIRVIDFSGGEDLIEFVNAGYADFELRAKDIAVFSYLENKLRIVQNLTIGQYMTVSAPKCYLATYVYGSTSEAVETLRLFRDTVLLASPFLSLCVTTYYRISPSLIKWGSNATLFKTASRALLNPIVRIATWCLWYRARVERG